MAGFSVTREFNIAVLGAAEVGKTSLVQRLCGKAFNRKSGYKPSLDEDATKYSVEVASSAGLLLFHFHDWAWAEKRREVDISRQLARGSDGALFLYDVTAKRSRSDFSDFNDWYERSAGFDKPMMIIANKNDQKKKVVQDTEGQALANKGDRRCFVAISLVDDTGVDEVMLSLSRLMMQDLNLVVSAVTPASEASLKWSTDRLSSAFAASDASTAAPAPLVKSKRVLLLVMNSSVVAKFEEALATSEFVCEAFSSVGEMTELLPDTAPSATENPEAAAASTTTTTAAALPIVALAGPPTMTDGQKAGLTALAVQHGLPAVVAIPRALLTELQRATT